MAKLPHAAERAVLEQELFFFSAGLCREFVRLSKSMGNTQSYVSAHEWNAYGYEQRLLL